MRWQANACRTFSGGSAAGACATRTGSTALGVGQRSANVSACASVAVQIAATVRTTRLAITGGSYRRTREETVDLGRDFSTPFTHTQLPLCGQATSGATALRSEAERQGVADVCYWQIL